VDSALSESLEGLLSAINSSDTITSPLRGWLRQNPEMDATNADTRLCMALDARRFAHGILDCAALLLVRILTVMVVFFMRSLLAESP
jgi:hypothetical protein